MKSFFLRSSKSKAPKFGATQPGETSYEPFRHLDEDTNTTTERSSLQGTRKIYGRKNSAFQSFRVIGYLASSLVSIALVGVTTQIIIILKNSKDSRLLWSHGMMMKAWPVNGDALSPFYLLLAAASFTVLLNLVAVLSFVRRGDTSEWLSCRDLSTIAARAVATALLLASVITIAVHDPNLRSWSCENKYLEYDYEDNVVGFESVCSESSGVYWMTIGATLIEGYNAITAILFVASERRKAKARSRLPKVRQYRKIDPAVEEQDDVPMLDNVARASMQ